MSDQLLFENNFLEEEIKHEQALKALKVLEEAEPSHGSEASDIATTLPKAGFAKATLSKSLPAMVSYVQKLNGPVGYVFGFRPKGASGSTNDQDGVHVTNTNDPDNIESQGTKGEVGPGEVSPASTTISVLNPLTNETSEDFMIARKFVEAKLREVKIDMTNEVEQDVLALFGGHFDEKYYSFVDPTDNSNMEKVASFFFEYATTQMLKKTNAAFVTYLDDVATNVGTAPITSSDDLIFAVAEMQAKLYGGFRKKVAGRTWAICAPDVASAISTYADIYNGASEEHKVSPTSAENTYVCTIGNLDVYSSSDMANGGIIMGILGNANVSSVYYTPYNEYMINSGADAYTGISNIFFRVRDSWVTNPLDTFSGTEPTPTTVDDSGYPDLTVVEGTNNSDLLIKGTLTLPTLFA